MSEFSRQISGLLSSVKRAILHIRPLRLVSKYRRQSPGDAVHVPVPRFVKQHVKCGQSVSLHSGDDRAFGDLSARGPDYLQNIKFVVDPFGMDDLTRVGLLKLCSEN